MSMKEGEISTSMSRAEMSEEMQARAGSVKEAWGCVTPVTLPGLTGML